MPYPAGLRRALDLYHAMRPQAGTKIILRVWRKAATFATPRLFSRGIFSQFNTTHDILFALAIPQPGKTMKQQ